MNHFKQNVEALRPKLELVETEDSWEAIAKSIQSLTVLCNDGACDEPEQVIPIIRELYRTLISAMKSERTRLSGTAMDLVGVIASGLGTSFDQLLPLFFPTLLLLCGRTNKVMIARARACILTIIECTQLPAILTYLAQNVKDKSPTMRLAVAEFTLTCVNCLNPPDLEKEARIHDIEVLIRSTARDANADIRKISRSIFGAYKVLFPNRVETFTAPLTPTMKKYLDIKKPSGPMLPPELRAQPPPKMLTSLSTSNLATTATRPPIKSSASAVAVRNDVSTSKSTTAKPPSRSHVQLNDNQESRSQKVAPIRHKPSRPFLEPAPKTSAVSVKEYVLIRPTKQPEPAPLLSRSASAAVSGPARPLASSSNSLPISTLNASESSAPAKGPIRIAPVLLMGSGTSAAAQRVPILEDQRLKRDKKPELPKQGQKDRFEPRRVIESRPPPPAVKPVSAKPTWGAKSKPVAPSAKQPTRSRPKSKLPSSRPQSQASSIRSEGRVETPELSEPVDVRPSPEPVVVVEPVIVEPEMPIPQIEIATQTPQQRTPEKRAVGDNKVPYSAMKTPISSLLLAIQRGFDESPPPSPSNTYFSSLRPTSNHLVTPYPLHTRKSSINLQDEKEVRRVFDDIFNNE
ncbi:clasp N terminal-domain-containing protein [Mycena floridula]|nr:clasp N terminal-domain-containing protein [Mycena floridula]